MNKKHVLIGGLMVAAMMVASSVSFACPCGAGAQKGGWEYIAKRMKAPRKGKWLNRWNEMGSQGWKLVSTSENVYVFMRPAAVGWADSSTVTESTMPAAVEPTTTEPAVAPAVAEPEMTKADKKADKEAKKAADKAEKEAKKAEKAQMKAEKKAKAEEMKAAKKAEKEAKKAAKEAEKAAEKAESSN